MNHVAGMPCFFSSARMRPAAITPNSPRDTGVGVVIPRAIQPEIASKSKLMQTICATRGWSAASIQLQARLLHDRGVSVVLPLEELGVFLGRVARGVQAERNEAAPDVGVLENFPCFGRKPRAQIAWHSRGRHEAD